MTLGHSTNSTLTARHAVLPRLASFLTTPLRLTIGFARRVATSIHFRSRRALNFNYLGFIRGRLLFPVRNILLRHKPLTIQAAGQKYLLAAEGAIATDMWAGRYFEKQELELLLSMLQPGMTFVDVGANVGLFSIPAARKVADGCIYALEPASWTFERLTKNIHLNQIANLKAMRLALGERSGMAVLHINARGRDGLNTLGEPTHGDSKVIGSEEVPLITLDDFLVQRGVARVDAMKIDVEGAELLVLKGGANLLSRADAPLILFESSFLTKGFGYHPVETVWLLQRYGYRLFVVNPKGLQPLTRVSLGLENMVAVKTSHPLYDAVKVLVR